MMETNPTKAMTDRERKIQVLDLVCTLIHTEQKLLPEELADLRSLLEDLKGDGSDWVSVTKSLPKPHTKVFVPGGIGYWNGASWFTLTDEPYPGRPIQWKVTHWMNLPTEPKP